MRRLLALLPVLIAFQAGAPPALAWTWPADGPVLRAFSFGDDPFAAGQHRGVDVAGETGAPVRSPRAGVVSFAGSVPGGGRTVTVQTSDGLSVTLVHLGVILVARDELLAEGDAVGTIGPSGEAEHSQPYVHLGVRVASDAQGYRDPLSFLPDRGPVTAAPPAPSAGPVAAPLADVPDAPSSAPDSPAPAPPSEAPAPAAPPSEGPVASPAPVPAISTTGPQEHAPAGEAPAHAAGERPTPAAVARETRVDGERVRPAKDVRAAAAGRAPGATEEGDEAPDSRGERPLPVSVERPTTTPTPGASLEGSPPDARPTSPILPVAIAGLGIAAAILALCAVLARRRLQLPQAGAAHALTAVLDDGAGRPAEQAGRARPAQEDRPTLDRDLERVVLDEPEPPSDLDRNDDPAELVQVANDACRRPRATIAATRFHRLRPRPPSRCRRLDRAPAP
jgi:hypothetical protein